MRVPELAPLLEKVRALHTSASTRDIATFVEKLVTRANTPSMGQSACDEIITMCHPKGWGDRQVEGLGGDWAAWGNYLEELSELAELCGQAIYDNSKKA
jgi:hypothetical protein